MLVIQCHVFSNFPQQFLFRSIYLVNIFPLVPDTLYWHRGWNIGRHTAISRYRDRNWARSRNRIWAGKGKKQGRGPLHLSMHRLKKDQKNLGDSWKDNWSMRCPFWLQSGQEVLYCTRPQGHLRPLLLYIKNPYTRYVCDLFKLILIFCLVRVLAYQVDVLSRLEAIGRDLGGCQLSRALYFGEDGAARKELWPKALMP